MKKLTLSVLILSIAFLASCVKGVDEVEKQKENEKAIKEYLAANGLTPDADSLGVYTIIRDSNPTSRRMTVGDSVEVKLQFFLLNGTEVLKSATEKPIKFIHGYAPISGIDLTVASMRVGEKATSLIPYYLAWGSGGSSDGQVPAYTPIRLEIEIIVSRSEKERIAEFFDKKGYTPDLVIGDQLSIFWLNKVEEGDSLGMGKNVTVAYTGRFPSGQKFDDGAYSFLTGSSGMNSPVKGFDLGVRRMKVGEKAIIAFTSNFGYGSTLDFLPTVPPFAPLTFEIEVKKAD